MFKESKSRSIVKTISWRILATITTFILVYIFTGNFNIAFTVGFLEVFLKMLIYFFHERAWDKIKFGRKEIKPLVIWLTGLTSSGKNELAVEIVARLKKMGLKVDLLDGHSVRKFFPETGFSRDEVNSHIKRVGYLAKTLEKNGVIVVASFLSPYAQSRKQVRELCDNFNEIFVDATLDYCKNRDKDGVYSLFEQGKIKNLPGLDVSYEKPENPELILSPDVESKNVMIKKIMNLVDNYVQNPKT